MWWKGWSDCWCSILGCAPVSCARGCSSGTLGLTVLSLVFGVAALPPSAQHGELVFGEGTGESLLYFADVGEFLVGPVTRVTGVVTHAGPPVVAPGSGPG